MALRSKTLTDDEIAIAKLLISRGIHHQDIAALLQCNSGRIAEINTGSRGKSVAAAVIGPTVRRQIAALYSQMTLRHARLFGPVLPPVAS